MNPPELSTAPGAPAAPPLWRRGPVLVVLALVVALLALLGQGLGRDPRELPSALIGQPWPAFQLVGLQPPHATWTAQRLQGQPRVVNVWASWCSACREEHPALLALAQRLRAQGRAEQLLGLNYKDQPQAALAWLAQGGDPYADAIVDPQGRLGLDLGVYGVPETFVTDAQGVIRYKHVGPLTPEVIEREILPRLEGRL